MRSPVVSEILKRKTGAASSGAKLGLVIEGGGMRGVYSGGALKALADLGLHSAFDAIFAESAGAINACYFLSNQVDLGLSIYVEDLTSLRFFNPLRLGSVLDIGFLIEEVVAHRKPLNIAKVLASPTHLHVALTNALDGSAHMIDTRITPHSLLTILRATAVMVPLYNEPVQLDGVPYVDGGISNPLPILSAIKAGCTHILVLLTRPRSFRIREFSGRQQMVLEQMLKRWPAPFRQALLHDRVQRYKQARALAFGESDLYPDVKITVIEPTPDSPKISRVTRSAPALRAAIEDARRRTQLSFRAVK